MSRIGAGPDQMTDIPGLGLSKAAIQNSQAVGSSGAAGDLALVQIGGDRQDDFFEAADDIIGALRGIRASATVPD
jgi:hypothetical protein